MTPSNSNEKLLPCKYYMYFLKANMVLSTRGNILGTIDIEPLIR